MKFIETELKDVVIVEPDVFGDHRGYFMETWKDETFRQHFPNVNFIQDNESMSSQGVIRGLHYQKGEWSQAKLVRVIMGTVYDVAVDLRKNSPTFGKHVIVELSGENKRQLFVPRGMAHGFLVTSPSAVFAYKVDNVYRPDQEACIRWDDKELNIQWPFEGLTIQTSEKDAKGVAFADAIYF